MTSLPRQEEINVYDTLEERDAVKEFHGKTRDEIFRELLDDGYQYLQELLAFMGPVAFAYYAPSWEQLFSHYEPDADHAEKLDSIAQWTKSIIAIRSNSLEKETTESLAALRRMLACCENFYHSAICRAYYTANAQFWGYAESLLSMPPELQEELGECARLRALLEK